MTLEVYRVSLPSLAEIDPEQLLPADGSPLFENLLCEERFAGLRPSFDDAASGIEPLPQPCTDGCGPVCDPEAAETTAILPAVTDDAPAFHSGLGTGHLLRLPADVGSAHTPAV